MNLETQILELTELFNERSFNASVEVTEGRNHTTSRGKLNEALAELTIIDNTPLSIRTYTRWGNESDYVECYFRCQYNNDRGFGINSLSIEENNRGSKKNLKINIGTNENLPYMINIETMLSNRIELKNDEEVISNKMKFKR